MADGAADNPAVVAFAGFAFAAEEDTHQPPVPAAIHDLPGFSRQTQPPSQKSGTPLAHRRPQQLLRFNDLGGGGERGNQSGRH
jgi:hypothetical protein